jgi:hypothetical protein
MFNINLKQPDPGFNVILFQDNESISTGYTAVSFDLVSSILGNMQSSSVYFSGDPVLLNIYLTGSALTGYSAGYNAVELLDLGVSFIGQGTTSGNAEIAVDTPALLTVYLSGEATLGPSGSNGEYTLENPVTGLISIPQASFSTSVDYTADLNTISISLPEAIPGAGTSYTADINSVSIILSDPNLGIGAGYTADVNILNLTAVSTVTTDVDIQLELDVINLTTDILSPSVIATSLLELTTTLIQPSISDGNTHINHTLVDAIFLLTDIYEPSTTTTTRRLVSPNKQPTTKNANKGKGAPFPVSKQLVDGNYSTRNTPLPVSKRLVDGNYVTKNTPLPI